MKKNILFIFRERGREGEREGEKHQRERETSVISYTRSDWGPRPMSQAGINQQCFASQDGAQPTEPRRSGSKLILETQHPKSDL